MVHGLVLAEAKTLVREYRGVKNKAPYILSWAVRLGGIIQEIYRAFGFNFDLKKIHRTIRASVDPLGKGLKQLGDVNSSIHHQY